MLEVVESMGVTVLPGRKVDRFTFEHSGRPSLNKRDEECDGSTKGKPRITGVILTDGAQMHSDLVVVATGAWTPQLFAGIQGDSSTMSSPPDVIATG
jgi:hypothetical protein